MSRTEALLAALEASWDEVAALFGVEWPATERDLLALLEQLRSRPEDEAVLRALVLDRLSVHREAERMVRDRMDVAPSASKGGWRAALARLLGRLVTRIADVSLPETVSRAALRVSAVIRIRRERSDHATGSEAISARIGRQIIIRVEAPAFEVLGDGVEIVELVDGKDATAVFDLRPRVIGATRVNFDLLQDGNPLGTLSVPVTITDDVAGDASRTAALKLRIASDPPPARVLYIGVHQTAGGRRLAFTLHRGSDTGESFPPIELPDDVPRVATRHYAALDKLTAGLEPTAGAGPGSPPGAGEIDRRVKALGHNLWRDLIPEALRRVYAAEREAWRDEAFLIVSDEPHIPWELVWPYEAAGWEDEAPWCVRMRLTRWVRRDFRGNGHVGPPTTMSVRALACLAPTDAGLPAAQRERQRIADLLAACKLVDASPAVADRAAVLALLEHDSFDWLHVASHGSFRADTPDGDSALWLEDGQPITPDAIVGGAIEGAIARSRAGFVFNACHGARQAWTLNRLGGWANRLIAMGAGVFIAPMWSVTDSAALDFATVLYRQLVDGHPLATAVREARMAARRTGDPSWLAYAVYGHPEARVVFAP